MTIHVGILRAAALAKESSLGVLNSTPDLYIPYIPPVTFSPEIAVLESMGIRATSDKVIKALQGPAQVKGGKVKFEIEPENIGEHLLACFGQDSLSEVASFTVTNSNKYIDFDENAGGQLHATIALGTYAAGQTSSDAGTLCAAIKTALQAVGAGVYTVTFSRTTKKFTIAVGSGTFNLLFSTGTNVANSARDLLGFAHTDTGEVASATAGTAVTPVFQHNFQRAGVAQLPSYSWWIDSGNKFMQFTGGMLNKIDIGVKAKEYALADADWTALSYDDTGSGKSPVYSTLKPLTFNEAVVKVDGVQSLDYDNLKISIDNMVKAEHSLSGSIYTSKIWTEGMRVTISADLYFEDATQFNRFLAGTAAAFNIKLTSSDQANGIPYSLALDLPTIQYLTAPLHNPVGVLKVPFAGVGVFTAGMSNYTTLATLVNSKAFVY